MTTHNGNYRPDIVLFQWQENQGTKTQTSLRKFLSFLKMNKVTAPIRFSYIDREGSLLPGLSLKENISLDSIPSTVSASKEFTLEDHLERLGNKALITLYQKIDLVEDLPYQVDAKTRKIAALVKGLLQKSDYLFMDSPERYLDDATLEIFTNALQNSLENNGQTLFLVSDNLQTWTPYVTKTVTEKTCPQTGKLDMLIEDKVVRSFTASLKESTVEDGLLIFNHPTAPLPLPLQKVKKAS